MPCNEQEGWYLEDFLPYLGLLVFLICGLLSLLKVTSTYNNLKNKIFALNHKVERPTGTISDHHNYVCFLNASIFIVWGLKKQNRAKFTLKHLFPDTIRRRQSHFSCFGGVPERCRHLYCECEKPLWRSLLNLDSFR